MAFSATKSKAFCSSIASCLLENRAKDLSSPSTSSITTAAASPKPSSVQLRAPIPKTSKRGFEVRGNASLESPHILVLIDDPKKEIIEPLFDEDYPNIVDFELMMNGGQLKYHLIENKKDIARIAQKLAKCIEPDYIQQKYGVENETLLYAMGDGNHSFAAAQKSMEKN